MTTKNPAAVELGRLGGKAGKGDAKRRSPEHYRKMVEARKNKTHICDDCLIESCNMKNQAVLCAKKMRKRENMTDKEKGTYRRILPDGKINTILKDGTSIINGHVAVENGKNVFRINGYTFDPSDGFDVREDLR